MGGSTFFTTNKKTHFFISPFFLRRKIKSLTIFFAKFSLNFSTFRKMFADGRRQVMRKSGQERLRTGRSQDRRESGQERVRTGETQDRRESGQEGVRTGESQDRRE